MPWLQCSFETDRDNADAVSERLSRWGALSVTLTAAGDDRILETTPGENALWNRLRVTALFDKDSDIDKIAARLAVFLGNRLADDFDVEHIGDRDWEREWLKNFRSLRFGDRLWICPTSGPFPDTDGAVVKMDPGLAFGTGTHATTALCLEWLGDNDLSGLTMVDYGCGSGILAVSAACLGARHVYAVDHDLQALQATRANAVRNGVGDVVEVLEPLDVLRRDSQLVSNVVMANILATPLIDLADTLAELVTPGGQLVMSGILVQQGSQVSERYSKCFELIETVDKDGWLRLSCRRKPEEN
jgi:ribosomal protein L11 methyltransferase